MSPVGSKKKVLNPEPGRNCAFSGRLNGVAPAALAAAFALNAANPLAAVSWRSTHIAGHDVPGVCKCSCAVENVSPTGSAAWNLTGAPSTQT